MKFILTALFLSLVVHSGVCQTILQTPLPEIRNGENLSDVLTQIEKEKPVRFFYSPEWLSSFTIKENLNGLSLEEFLNTIFKDSEFSFRLLYGYAVVIMKDPYPFMEYKENLMNAIQSKKIIESITLGERKDLIPGKKYSISGSVKDRKVGNNQPNITVLLNNKVVGITDTKGRYEITTLGGDYLLSFPSLTFEEKIIDLHLFSAGEINILLEENSIILDEVVVSGQNIVNNNAGQLTINLTDLKRSATLLGEADVIKQLQHQAGITNVGEIAGGFNVRGGGVDQNLILFDEIPVFNTYHAIGFFSSFNSEAIKEASFYKGGIPSQYGGRVSSVLAIKSKSGYNDHWRGGGGIGLLSSHFHVGGPIKKETTTLFASVRGSYSDWVLNTIESNYKDLQNSSIAFIDGTVNLEHKFNEKSSIRLSGYTSYDAFTLVNDTSYHYQNKVGALQYYYQFSNRFSGNVHIGVGEYTYTLKEKDPPTAFDLSYSITYPSLKLDFNYDGDHHNLSFGWQNTFYAFNPGTLTPGSAISNTATIRMEPERSLESAVYVSDEFSLQKNLTILGGLRFSVYTRVGPGKVYHYAPDKPREVNNIIDTTTYTSGSNMKMYYGLEPRFSIRYSLHDDAALKIGYNRMFQYVHLISNTAAVTPVDIWQSSNANFKPQVADQISLGYYRNLYDQTFGASIEVFYKRIENILDFKDGAELILNEHLETDLLTGKGKAYGVELSVQKMKGRLQGSTNYTYARSLRTVDGRFASEKINDGYTYPSNYDQPHVFNVDWRYGISRRHFFSGTFTYHTGRPMSVPLSSYLVDGVPVLNYSDRNKYRIPDYHRLDIAFIIEGNHKKKKVWDGTWTVSFYNIYFRKNAYSVFYQPDGSNNLQPYKLAIIGTAVPSVAYSFRF